MADSISERKEIKKMGGKAQKNSGRGQYMKGDATLGPFVVDVKESVSHFGLDRKTWVKVCTDAAKHRAEPALMVALGQGRETIRMWVIADSMFHEMLSAYQEKHGGE